jgi:hypothetical protein
VRLELTNIGFATPSADLLSLFTAALPAILKSNLHFRQFNGSKTRIVDKVGMRNLWVLIELAATNWFQRRQRIGSSHSSKMLLLLVPISRTSSRVGFLTVSLVVGAIILNVIALLFGQRGHKRHVAAGQA